MRDSVSLKGREEWGESGASSSEGDDDVLVLCIR